MIADKVLRQLVAVVGERYALTDPVELTCYAYDATHYTHCPDVVLFPADRSQIVSIMNIANRERVPVVPRGAGTSLSGGATPLHGGIVLSTTRLDRVLDVDTVGLTATTEPGVITAELQRRVESVGLFYPPDPSSLNVSTIGGNVVYGSGGPRGVKYGTTKDYVLGLEVVLADGRVLNTEGAADERGFDLTRLFVSSEGTLGVITKIKVRLLPLPEARQTALAVFDSLDATGEAVAAIIAARIVPTSMELMDNFTIRTVEEYRPVGLPLDAEGILLMEVDGFACEVAEQIEKVAAIAKGCGAREVKIARSREENDDLWSARRSAYAAQAKARPTAIVEDATVPRSCVPAMLRKIGELARKHRLNVPVLAHAGDGNTHPVVLCDWRDKEEMERADRFAEELFRETVAMGGTLTGEHGIGLVKKPFLECQHGPEGVAAMRLVKKAFDPHNILNPGKVLPE
ncbi:MAG: FAD-binding oxidoreductase [Chloroflexota bacterium]